MCVLVLVCVCVCVCVYVCVFVHTQWTAKWPILNPFPTKGVSKSCKLLATHDSCYLK